MKNKKILKNKWFILATILILFSGIYLVNYILVKRSTNNSMSYLKNEKVFESKFLKFSLDLPTGFQATDELSTIIARSEQGNIHITRNGTQFNSLSDYLNEFDQNTTLKFSENLITINNYDSALRKIQNSDIGDGQENIYFIYVDNLVYKISTTDVGLFDELDQIAQSFKYTGN